MAKDKKAGTKDAAKGEPAPKTKAAAKPPAEKKPGKGKPPAAKKAAAPPEPAPPQQEGVPADLPAESLLINRQYQQRSDSRDFPDCANPDRVDAYVELMESGVEFPRVRVADTGSGGKFVVGGFHTFAAHRRRGLKQIPCLVFSMSHDAAVWFSVVENQGPAARDDETLRNCILAALALPGSEDLSVREIARRVGASKSMVQRCRTEVEEAALLAKGKAGKAANGGLSVPRGTDATEEEAGQDDGPPEEAAAEKPAKKRKVNRNGSTYEMNVSGVGKSKKKAGGDGASATAAPAVAAAAAGPASVKDALGNEVPDRLRDVFGDIVLDDMASHCATMRKNAREAITWAVHLELGKALDALDEAERIFRAAVPYCLCPDCNGLPEASGCALCLNSGYMTQQGYENLNGAAAPSAAPSAVADSPVDDSSVPDEAEGIDSYSVDGSAGPAAEGSEEVPVGSGQDED